MDETQQNNGEMIMTKLLISLLILASASVFGQPRLTPTLSEPFTYPGSTSLLTITLFNSGTFAIEAIQFTITPPTGFTMGTPTTGIASTSAGKTVSCSPTTNTCVISSTNPNITTFSDGTLVLIPFTVATTTTPVTTQIPITGIMANSTGGPVPMVADVPAPITIAPIGGNIPWFNVSSGGITCKASKIAQVPMRLEYGCFDKYGAAYGAYTADTTNGPAGANYFYIGLNSQSILPVNPQINSNLSCLIQINATGNAVMMVGLLVPAATAAYSCNGFSGSGNGTISWP